MSPPPNSLNEVLSYAAALIEEVPGMSYHDMVAGLRDAAKRWLNEPNQFTEPELVFHTPDGTKRVITARDTTLDLNSMPDKDVAYLKSLLDLVRDRLEY